MVNQLCAYVINDPTVFSKIATLSGLTTNNTFIRLSPDQIYGLKDSIDCMTSGAINAFIGKYPNLSGDCYVTLTSDKNGNEVLALDIVRPDDPSKTNHYVMDQEPIYIVKHPLGWEYAEKGQKVFHLNYEGRTFSLNKYSALSSFLDDKRDVPVTYNEISSFDPGVFKAIVEGVSLI